MTLSAREQRLHHNRRGGGREVQQWLEDSRLLLSQRMKKGNMLKRLKRTKTAERCDRPPLRRQTRSAKAFKRSMHMTPRAVQAWFLILKLYSDLSQRQAWDSENKAIRYSPTMSYSG